MMRALWIAKTGLEGQQTRLDVVSNNLANVSTNGFKRQRAIFEDLLYQQAIAPGALTSQQTSVPAGLQMGLGVRAVANPREFTQGSIQATGNNMDIAIQGNGFFSVQLPDGTTAYTRDGNFQRDSQGQMVTQSGYLVLPGITIPANAKTITIGKDGVVSVTTPAAVAPQQLGQIQLSTFINPVGLQSLGENLLAETQASGAVQEGVPGTDGLGLLNQGFVESSNVNVAEELVTMIETQRAYELNSKAISTADQMLARLSQLN